MPEQLYHALLAAYGPQHWWPAKGLFEMMAGAVLVQNTAWTQAARAVARLEADELLCPAAIRSAPPERIMERIRPAGYFRVKYRRLLALATFLAPHDHDLEGLFNRPCSALRPALLGIHGIGPETADSILCYGGGLAIFVVDAYTRRLFGRLGWTDPQASYDRIQSLVQQRFPASPEVWGELHALIVRHAKGHCRVRPLCRGCPLFFCPSRSETTP